MRARSPWTTASISRSIGRNVYLNLFVQTAPSGSSSFLGIVPILLIFGIFYFLLFLPMQRQKKQQQKMLASLENGQVVITSGGIVGTVVAIDNDILVLRVKPDNIKIQVTRGSVSSLAAAEGKK